MKFALPRQATRFVRLSLVITGSLTGKSRTHDQSQGLTLTYRRFAEAGWILRTLLTT